MFFNLVCSGGFKFKKPEFDFNDLNSNLYVALTVVTAVLLLAVLFFVSGKEKNTAGKTRMMAFAGVSIALGSVLSLIRLWRMPLGGSITPASMLPLAIFAFAFGPKKGVLVSFVYGLLQVLLGGWVVHPLQLLLDYPLAYAMIGLSGVFYKSKNRWMWLVAFTIGVVARYLMHVLSGVAFWDVMGYDAAGFGYKLTYSLGYNSYLFVDGAIAAALMAVLLTNKSFVGLIKSVDQK